MTREEAYKIIEEDMEEVLRSYYSNYRKLNIVPMESDDYEVCSVLESIYAARIGRRLLIKLSEIRDTERAMEIYDKLNKRG